MRATLLSLVAGCLVGAPCVTGCDDGADGDADSDLDADADADAGLTPDQEAFFARVDALHAAAGCDPFTWDDRLAAAAQVGAQRMTDSESFDVCSDARERLADAGLPEEDHSYVRQTCGFRSDIDTFVAELLDNEHVADCGCELAGVGVVHSDTAFGGGYFACALYVAR